MTGIGHDKSRSHIERCCLTCPVGTKQTYNLALSHINGDIVDNGAFAILFYKTFGTKHHPFAPYAGACHFVSVHTNIFLIRF